jgi:hypothetical protein
MSLIQGHWIPLAGGAVLAVLLPVKMLSSDAAPVALAPPPPPARVDLASAAGLSYALTAPPFTQERVPQAAAPEPSAAAPPAEPAPPPAPPPALVGVAVAGRGRAVALARGANGETLTLARGEAIDGWTVVAIGRDGATFEREGTRHTAQLDFANRTAATPPTPVPPTSIPAVSSPAASTDRNPS